MAPPAPRPTDACAIAPYHHHSLMCSITPTHTATRVISALPSCVFPPVREWCIGRQPGVCKCRRPPSSIATRARPAMNSADTGQRITYTPLHTINKLSSSPVHPPSIRTQVSQAGRPAAALPWYTVLLPQLPPLLLPRFEGSRLLRSCPPQPGSPRAAARSRRQGPARSERGPVSWGMCSGVGRRCGGPQRSLSAWLAQLGPAGLLPIL